MKKQQEFLKKHFEELGGTIEFQRFTARQLSRKDQQVEMANMIVSWFPERQRRVILCSHYDTRPIADQERNRRDWDKPFISANDGGSGVALLMELANHMKKLDTQVGVDFVFFDGEEYIYDPGDGLRDGDKYFFGSEHFAKEYKRTKPKHRYIGAILFDMIAGKNAQFPIEQHSWISAGALAQDLWRVAEREKCTAFLNRMGQGVRDDHIALNANGIPAVDIIDFDYPHWHKLSDTPENCSASSLAQVAKVVIAWLKIVR
jgi:Zn-dependent M28 family amino/carboxypeptidase